MNPIDFGRSKVKVMDKCLGVRRCNALHCPYCILNFNGGCSQCAISQLRIVCSGLHLFTYLDAGNFCDKSTETSLHKICVEVFLRFSDSSKPSPSVSLIYELAWLAIIHKSEENLLKTSCKVAPMTKVAHLF